jgi:hypothetical protein
LLVANQNALVVTVGVVAVAIGIIVRSSCHRHSRHRRQRRRLLHNVSPPAIARTAVADRCRASLDRACNRGSVTTASADAAKRPSIAARTSADAQSRSRTAEAGVGRAAEPHGRPTCECGRTAGRDRRRTARPHGRRRRKLCKHRSRRQGNRCERYADGQRQECLPGHDNLRFRFAFQGPAPARLARASGSSNGCRAPGLRPLALAGCRREQGGSGTTLHIAPAGTTASAACRR